MNERKLQRFIRANLLMMFDDINVHGRVQRAYDNDSGVAPSIPTLTYHRIATAPAGWTYTKNEPDGLSLKEVTYSNKLVTIQINAIVAEPENETEDDITAADLIEKARMHLQSQQFLKACKDLGINVLPVSGCKDVPTLNESDDWEYQSSFDITFAFKSRYARQQDAISGVGINIHRV